MFNAAFESIELSVRRFLASESGASAIEYAIIASGIAIVIAAAIVALGSKVQGLFNGVLTAMK